MSVDGAKILQTRWPAHAGSCEVAPPQLPELKQAVGNIWVNADAALRWICREAPDLNEARAVIENIIAESRRASEAILSLDEVRRN